MKMITMNRRQFGLTAASGLLLPAAARATSYQEITWDDLVPPGIPYAEVIGEGDLDEQTDTWRPIFDENGVKLNAALDGQQIKMPGYITPLEITSDGMTEFLLVPYLGACLCEHTNALARRRHLGRDLDLRHIAGAASDD
jgi:hypothetical protein